MEEERERREEDIAKSTGNQLAQSIRQRIEESMNLSIDAAGGQVICGG